MADEVEEAPMSLQERIARLQMNQLGKAPRHQIPAAKPNRPLPPPRPELPARPPALHRPQSANVPTGQAIVPIGNQPEITPPSYGASSNGMDGISRPSLPPRTSTSSSLTPILPQRPVSQCPALPSRRPSQASSPPEYDRSRRTSIDSMSSIGTAISSVSGISTTTSMTSDRAVRAPSYDPAALPVLPPKNPNTMSNYYASGSLNSKRAPLKSKLSSPNLSKKQEGTTPPPARQIAQFQSVHEQQQLQVEPSPQMPVRPVRPVSRQVQPQFQIEPVSQPPIRGQQQSVRQLVEPPPPRKSALSYGMNQSTATPPPLGARSGSLPTVNNAAPPPVPTASRPDLAALLASKPKTNGSSAPVGAPSASSEGCLACRDFSSPDNHAARFPRESIPSNDVGWLAAQLTDPFPSVTDKARALFTWLHHNVAYDVVALNTNSVKPSTPHGTIASGLAVCEGYASLFAALALKAGLEAFLISGASKGGNYRSIALGESIPPYKASHAWNAVKLDDGQWKLIDCCWGAGSVSGPTYIKQFKPDRFTESNMDFGRDHFPGDNSQQFREDGRTISYDEYVMSGCKAQLFSGFLAEEGMRTCSVRPAEKTIVLAAQQGPTVRFSFQKNCPHWDPVRNGRGPYYLYLLKTEASAGTAQGETLFETNGEVWWCDVPTAQLGPPGQKVMIYIYHTFMGKDARGTTAQQWNAKGSGGWGYAGVAEWELV